MKAILIETDGYFISTSEFTSKNEAVEAMKTRYANLSPKHNDESSAEMSYIDETDAILYQNGENVYVWKIIIV